jgi:uncharacterized lipoprotein YajG
MEGLNFTGRRSPWAMLFIIAIAYSMGGCGFIANQPLEVTFTPKVSTPSISIGRGTKIFLLVLDQRTEKLLGYRWDPNNWQALGLPVRGTVSASEDVAEVIQKSLKDGLTSLGFVTLTAPDPSAHKLEVAVQHLRYSGWRMGQGTKVNFNATIVGKVYKDDPTLYARSYQYLRYNAPETSTGATSKKILMPPFPT